MSGIMPYGGGQMVISEPNLPAPRTREEAELIRLLRGVLWRKDAMQALGPAFAEACRGTASGLAASVAQQGLYNDDFVEAIVEMSAVQPGRCRGHEVAIRGRMVIRRGRW